MRIELKINNYEFHFGIEMKLTISEKSEEDKKKRSGDKIWKKKRNHYEDY